MWAMAVGILTHMLVVRMELHNFCRCLVQYLLRRLKFFNYLGLGVGVTLLALYLHDHIRCSPSQCTKLIVVKHTYIYTHNLVPACPRLGPNATSIMRKSIPDVNAMLVFVKRHTVCRLTT